MTVIVSTFLVFLSAHIFLFGYLSVVSYRIFVFHLILSRIFVLGDKGDLVVIPAKMDTAQMKKKNPPSLKTINFVSQVSEDKDYILAKNDGSVLHYSLSLSPFSFRKQSCLFSFDEAPSALAISKGRVAVALSDMVKFVQLNDSDCIIPLKVSKQFSTKSFRIVGLGFTNSHLFGVSSSGTLVCWDLNTKKFKLDMSFSKYFGDFVDTCLFDMKDSFFVIAANSTIYIHSLEPTFKLVRKLEFPQSHVDSISLSSNGMYIAASNESSIFIYETSTFQQIYQIKLETGGNRITSLEFSNNHNSLLAMTEFGGLYLFGKVIPDLLPPPFASVDSLIDESMLSKLSNSSNFIADGEDDVNTSIDEHDEIEQPSSSQTIEPCQPLVPQNQFLKLLSSHLENQKSTNPVAKSKTIVHPVINPGGETQTSLSVAPFYLKWNSIATLISTPTQPNSSIPRTITIQLDDDDKIVSHPPKIVDYHGFNCADISHSIIVLGGQDHLAGHSYTLEFGSFSWNVSLPSGTKVESVACGTGWIGALFSDSTCHIFSRSGVPMYTWSLAGLPVCLSTNHENDLCIVYQKNGQLFFDLVVAPTREFILLNQPVSLSPQSTLEWIGFDSQGAHLVSVDSLNLIRRYSQRVWLPVGSLEYSNPPSSESPSSEFPDQNKFKLFAIQATENSLLCAKGPKNKTFIQPNSNSKAVDVRFVSYPHWSDHSSLYFHQIEDRDQHLFDSFCFYVDNQKYLQAHDCSQMVSSSIILKCLEYAQTHNAYQLIPLLQQKISSNIEKADTIVVKQRSVNNRSESVSSLPLLQEDDDDDEVAPLQDTQPMILEKTIPETRPVSAKTIQIEKSFDKNALEKFLFNQEPDLAINNASSFQRKDSETSAGPFFKSKKTLVEENIGGLNRQMSLLTQLGNLEKMKADQETKRIKRRVRPSAVGSIKQRVHR